MKKPKRSFDLEELEEKELDYSKELGIELDDDEVIDLEDIVEIPEDAEGDDLSLDVELLDVDSDLDLSDLDAKLKGSGNDDLLDEDLLKEFSFDEADEKPEEPAPEQNLDILGQGSVDDLLKEFSFPDDTSFESDAATEVELLEGDSKDDEFESFMDMDKELFSEPGKAQSPPVAEEPKIVAPAVAVAAAVEVDPAGLDDLVAQMENRLVETIREMVESRLPDIVRSVLREEIEKLKKEF